MVVIIEMVYATLVSSLSRASNIGKFPRVGLELSTSGPEPKTQPLHHTASTTTHIIYIIYTEIHIYTNTHKYVYTCTHASL